MGLSGVPETIGFAFQKGLTQVCGLVFAKAIPSLSSYCRDSEESQKVQIVAGTGRWKDGQEGTDLRHILTDTTDQTRGGFSIDMLAMYTSTSNFSKAGATS